MFSSFVNLNNTLKSIFLMLISTALNSFAQLFFKLGVSRVDISTIYAIITTSFNIHLLLGWLLYAFAALFFIFALRIGELSKVHPLLTISQIWTIILAYYYLNETINAFKISAIVLIIIGAIFISMDNDGDVK